ncbi:MAG: glycosyltransferase [Candidatus Omnitrophota bacterium]
MKFIFITREGYKNPGARIRCWDFSEKFREKGFDSSVFSFVDRLGAKSGKDDSEFTLREKLKYAYKGFRLLLKEAKNSVFIINRFNYHVVPAWFVSKFRKVPSVFDMDDWEARETPGSRAEYLSRSLAKNSMFCVAASNYLKNYLSQFNRAVYYIPTAVDTNKFKPSPRKGRNDFVFSWHGSVNRIELIAYIKFIIECFLTLYLKYSFIKLFIAADGIFERKLSELVRSYNCPNLIYKGWINYNHIPVYLDNVDCGLVPLLDRTRFNLSKSPVKLFEYMAKAKPVVASCLGEASYIIENGYNGFLASSEIEFISSMEQLIKNPVLSKNVGIAARKTIEERYSLAILGEQFTSIFAKWFQ